MSRLIPTPIVNKNGVATTVHKRADVPAKGIGALSNSRPVLAASKQSASGVHTIKPKKLSDKSDAIRIGKLFGALNSEDEIESFKASSGRSPVQMTDGEVYDALRKGFSIHDAAALKNLDISLDDVMERTKDHFRQGGSFNRMNGRGTNGNLQEYSSKIESALDRLQESGMSGLDADKLMLNGLQDGHFGRALSDDQLVELFSKWRFRTEQEHFHRGYVEQDDVIDALVSGRLPYELSRHKLSALKNIERESFDLFERTIGPDGRSVYQRNETLAERLKDREYLTKVADKAATVMSNEYRGLELVDAEVQKHGMEVLELNDPRMASIPIWVEAGVTRDCGIATGRYVERVLDLAREETEGDLWGTSSPMHTSMGAVKADGVYLRNHDLLDLYDAGVSAEEAYDLLVKHKLSKDQIIVARDTGVDSTLASGVL